MGPNASDEVGFMQRPVHAWRVLAATPNASPDFARLTSEGSPAGQLFGLAGLLLTDTLAARPVLERLLRDSTHVHLITPCETVEETTVRAIAAEIGGPGWVQAMRDSVARCKQEHGASAG